MAIPTREAYRKYRSLTGWVAIGFWLLMALTVYKAAPLPLIVLNAAVALWLSVKWVWITRHPPTNT